MAKLFGLSKQVVGELQIMIALVFYAISFMCQRKAMLAGMQPVTYNACRYTVSTLLLALLRYGLGWEVRLVDENEDSDTERPITAASTNNRVGGFAHMPTLNNYNKIEHMSNHGLRRDSPEPEPDHWSPNLPWISNFLLYGLILGFANFGGSVLQQMSLVTITVNKCGFITGMYVVFVPFAEYFFPCFEAQLNAVSWVAVACSLVGLYLLSGCAEDGGSCIGGGFGSGEVLVFISVFFWVLSIMVADLSSKQEEVVSMELLDFFTCTLLTIPLAIYLEPASWAWPLTDMRTHFWNILLIGCTEALAFLLCSLAQMHTSPTRASLLYSLEAALCSVVAYFYLGETMTPIEICGAGLMFLGALVSSVYPAAKEEQAILVARSRSVSMEIQRRLSDDHRPILRKNSSFGSLEMASPSIPPGKISYHLVNAQDSC